MSDLIEVIDNALPAELCTALIDRFEQSPNVSLGRTGGGVDLDKKRSMDVSISRNSEFQDLYQQVMQHTGKQLVSYIEKYFYALVGPIGLTVRHPKTGEPVKVTGENFEEVGKPNLANLVNYLYRVGDINAQRYTAVVADILTGIQKCTLNYSIMTHCIAFCCLCIILMTLRKVAKPSFTIKIEQ